MFLVGRSRRGRGLGACILLFLLACLPIAAEAQIGTGTRFDRYALREGEALRAVQDEQEMPSVVQSSPVSPWRRWCDSITQTQLAFGAMLMPGFGQVVNRDYWKLPLVYGGVVGFASLGLHYSNERLRLRRSSPPTDSNGLLAYETKLENYKWGMRFSYIAALATYSLSVADALYFHEQRYISPVTALFSSALFPGLGQVYTQQYWKIPVIYGAGILLAANLHRMSVLTDRYNKALTYLLDDNPLTVDEFGGQRSADDLEHMRDYYERWRDLDAILLSVLYALNVLDAYVAAHLFYWNVNDNLALRVQPSFTPMPISPQGVALGMQFQFTF